MEIGTVVRSLVVAALPPGQACGRLLELEKKLLEWFFGDSLAIAWYEIRDLTQTLGVYLVIDL